MQDQKEEQEDDDGVSHKVQFLYKENNSSFQFRSYQKTNYEEYNPITKFQLENHTCVRI